MNSSLNFLEIRHLSNLNTRQALEFIFRGFPQGLDPKAESYLIHMTGRHPYLLEGVLERLWPLSDGEIDTRSVKKAAQSFIGEVNPFPSWVKSFGEAEHVVFHALADSPQGALPLPELIKKTPSSVLPVLDETLNVLEFHGVIVDSDPDEPRVAGSMFHTWYRFHQLQDLIKKGRSPKPRKAKRAGRRHPVAAKISLPA